MRQASVAERRLAAEEVAAGEARDEGIRRRCDQLGWRADLEQLALDEDPDAPGERGGVLVVVRHEQRRQGEALQQLAQLRSDRHARVSVEGGQRLVEQQHRGIAGERTRETDALPLAARQRLGLRPRQVRDPETLEQLGDALAPGVAHVLLDGHVREERVVLEDEADAAALGWQVDPGLGVEQHRAVELDPPALGRVRPEIARSTVVLPGSGRADERHRLPTDGEVERYAEGTTGNVDCESERFHRGRSLTSRSTHALMTMSSALIASAVSKLTSSSA